MIKYIKYSGFVCALSLLTACSGREPSKDEIADYFIQKNLNLAFMFQHPSTEQRAKFIEQIKKELDIQSYDCKAVEGFQKVWDCKINIMAENQPQTATVRFNRDESGKIHGQE